MTAEAQRRMWQRIIILVATFIHVVSCFMHQRSAISGSLIPGLLIKNPYDDITLSRKYIKDRHLEHRCCHHDSERCKKRPGVRLSMITNDESSKAAGWTVLKEGHLYLPKGEQN